MRTLVDQAFTQASAILRGNRALLDRTAAALLETETLDEPEIERLKLEVTAPAQLPSPPGDGGAAAHPVLMPQSQTL